MDRGAWQVTVHWLAESDTTEATCVQAPPFQMLFVLQSPFPLSFIHLTDTIEPLLCMLHPHPPWSFPTLISTVFKHLSL